MCLALLVHELYRQNSYTSSNKHIRHKHNADGNLISLQNPTGRIETNVIVIYMENNGVTLSI